MEGFPASNNKSGAGDAWKRLSRMGATVTNPDAEQ